MNNEIVKQICLKDFGKEPKDIYRNETGLSSYVYIAAYDQEKFVIKISENENIISGSTFWFNNLKNLDLPIPKIISMNITQYPFYCIMTFLEGEDLGKVYTSLTENQKKDIAKQMFYYQNEAKKILSVNGYGYLNSYEDNINKKSSWKEVVYGQIKRAEERITKNKIFSNNYVNSVKKYFKYFDKYFSEIKPNPFFDDLTTKNVLINLL